MTTTTTLSPRFSPLDRLAETLHLTDEPPRLEWLFRGWLLARTLLWTLVATLTQHAPPLDAVEWLCWGRQWQLGYYKHPPLAAWVADLAYRLTPGSFFGVYLAGYLAIAAALWCVWQLARTMLPPRAALAATICLDGLVFFQQAAAEFNNQLLLIAFWSLAVLLFHRALASDRWRDWIGTGLALGLALLCKYSAVFLIVPLLALWLWHNGPRRLSRPAVVALTAALVFLPHFVWLGQNDFPTLRYAALRAQGETESYDHRLSAVRFLLTQGLRLLPVVVILAPLVCLRRSGRTDLQSVHFDDTSGRTDLQSVLLRDMPGRTDLQSVHFDDTPGRTDLQSVLLRDQLPGHPVTNTMPGSAPLDGLQIRPTFFVAVAVLGPLVLHLAASLVLGVTLRDIWGAPLWTFAGLLLLLLLESDTTDRAWRRMGLAWAGVTAVSLLLVLAGNLGGGWRGKPMRIHYPGPQLAALVTQRWQQRYGTPVPIVAGDWWLAGLVCCHAPHRPALYASLEPAAFGVDPKTRPGDPRRYANPDPRTSPWTGDADLRARGGLLVWDADAYGEDIPEWLRERFPTAEPQTPLSLDFAAGGPVLHVGWAMIAPG